VVRNRPLERGTGNKVRSDIASTRACSNLHDSWTIAPEPDLGVRRRTGFLRVAFGQRQESKASSPPCVYPSRLAIPRISARLSRHRAKIGADRDDQTLLKADKPRPYHQFARLRTAVRALRASFTTCSTSTAVSFPRRLSIRPSTITVSTLAG
jgi:hypothetical protein